MFPIERWCFYAQRFEQRGSFWSIRGGFVRKVVVLLDIRGASDGPVAERRCCFCEKGYSSSRGRAFFRRGMRV